MPRPSGSPTTASATDRFQRVDAVFDAVLDLPTEEQAAYIERTLSEDPGLRAEVIRLLKAHHRTGGILDSPFSRLEPLLYEAPAAGVDATGTRIGPFRVESAIGHGGMGQVYLGVRDDGQFEQRVALKLIRHPGPGLVRRFLDERRILARLEHPRIARLVDGGITADGLPYFAMEFVDGVPIDAYCKTNRLSLDARLALFEQVCEAVSYAHHHLVIHRDLKPGNILVTTDGQVKLLDFGIAKLIDEPGGHAMDETRTGFRVMTPDVAAPEQVRGQPVSTVTDVYALGILLYQLLAGERPYEVRGKSPAEVERIVCEYQPPAPSAKAAPGVQRHIDSDLDLITMTALHKQEQRRYQSAGQLARDIQRFRQGFAIQARPDSAGYRLGKFVRRHRVLVAAGAILLAVSIFGAARERVLRRRAEVAARKAAEVERFLVGVFDVADPLGNSSVARGSITAQELLDRGARRVDTTLAGQPEVQAELRTVLGRVYTNLALYQQATPLLRRALQQRIQLRGENDTSVASSMDQLGMALYWQNEHDESEKLLRQSLDIRRRAFGGRDLAVASSLGHLATLLEQRGDLAPAESLHREELAINRALRGDTALEVADAMNDLGVVLYRRGRYAESESLYRRTLAIREPRLGELNMSTAATVQNLATSLQQQGKFEEAATYHRRALASKRKVLGDTHPSVTISLNNFGVLLATQLNRLDEAESMTREAIALDRAIFGSRHMYVAEGLRNLSVIQRLKGEFPAAETNIREALAIDRVLLGEKNERMANFYSHLSHTRYQRGDSADATHWMRESLSRYRETLGEKHRNTALAKANLARLLSESGRAVEAESLARASLVILDSSNASVRPSYILALRTLGVSLLSQRRAQEAREPLEHAVAMARQAYGDSDWRTAHAQLSYSAWLVSQGKRDEALALMRAADVTLQRNRAAQPMVARQSAAALARLTR